MGFFEIIKSNISTNFDDSDIKVNVKNGTGYSDIIFKKIRFTELGFKKLYNFLKKNEITNAYISYYDRNYREIVIEANKFKIQSNGEYLLQLNLSNTTLYSYEDKLELVLNIIEKYFNTNVLCNGWNDLYLKILQEHHIKVIKNDEKEFGLLINGRLTVRQFYDESRKKTYVNFHGEYFALNLDEFRNYLRGDDLIISSSSEYRITDSGVSESTKLTYHMEGEEYSLRLNWVNSGFFSFILDGNDISAQEMIIIDKILEIILKKQEIKITPITSQLSTLSIGIIAEFGFPVDYLEEIIKNQLKQIGYSGDEIESTTINAMSSNSAKVNIVTGLETKENIDDFISLSRNRYILIGAGLEFGLSSICRTRLVKAYNQYFNEGRAYKTSDFSDISANLKSSGYITLNDGINKCFHKADFFVNYLSDEDINDSIMKIKYEVKRFFELVFGNQFITPTQDEFMMNMAFTSALRSADLSRQVGAVIANKNGDIIASGTNDIPQAGGGLYWPNNNAGFISEEPLGRDIARGFDSNAIEKVKIYENLFDTLADSLKVSKQEFVTRLLKSKEILLNDITEYGRVVHAEMEALMSCTRNGISTDGATLFCTTYPCHNCAKHIIAAGISRVVYIEPYSKSKAIDFHFEAVNHDNKSLDKLENAIDIKRPKVLFESFAGVGPRLFRELFVLGNRVRKSGSAENYGSLLKEWQPNLIKSLQS